jgi:2-iminobutanoate/2-iminopropanoate deaminase
MELLQFSRSNLHMSKAIIKTEHAPEPIGPYNQAVWAGDLLFISGQVALVPGTGELVMNSIEEETTQVMKNLQNILSAASLSFTNVVKTTIFLSDMSWFGQVNTIYQQSFTGDFPARETVAVKGLPRNVNVEISMIAVKNV